MVACVGRIERQSSCGVFPSFLRGRLAALDEVQPLERVRNATRASLVASWLPGFLASWLS